MSATTLAVLTMLALTVAAPARADDSSDTEVWKVDAEGRRFRVAFDPGSRIVLGAAWDGEWAADGGILVRVRDDQGVQWKIDHAFLSGRIWGGGHVDVSGYHGLFLRWSKDGALTIPTVPPARILLPFDLGFDVTVGRARLDPATDELRVGAFAGDLLFDFWRSYDFGSYFTLRTGLAYDVAVVGTQTPTHIITPFSRVGLDFAHEWDSGRETFEVHTALSHRTYVHDQEQRWATDAEALVAYEAVLIAINDTPLSLRLEGAWHWSDETDTHDLRGTVGLRMGFPLD